MKKVIKTQKTESREIEYSFDIPSYWIDKSTNRYWGLFDHGVVCLSNHYVNLIFHTWDEFNDKWPPFDLYNIYKFKPTDKYLFNERLKDIEYEITKIRAQADTKQGQEITNQPLY